VSRRDQIRLTEAELAAFLDEQRTVIVATNGRDGWPHLMPLWYTVRAGELWAWTYARSQKVRNLERDACVTWQVEAGEQYQELRGVMVKARVELHRDVETVAAFGVELFERYTGTSPLPDAVRGMVEAQAPKRVALRFVAVESPVTWDHGKLGGVY
jgi:PPOX class probable F420-dependent enzyme